MKYIVRSIAKKPLFCCFHIIQAKANYWVCYRFWRMHEWNEPLWREGVMHEHSRKLHLRMSVGLCRKWHILWRWDVLCGLTTQNVNVRCYLWFICPTYSCVTGTPAISSAVCDWPICCCIISCESLAHLSLHHYLWVTGPFVTQSVVYHWPIFSCNTGSMLLAHQFIINP